MRLKAWKIALVVAVVAAVLAASYFTGVFVTRLTAPEAYGRIKAPMEMLRGEKAISAKPATSAARGGEYGGVQNLDVIGRMIIRTAEIEIESSDPEKCLNEIMSIAESYGGYVQSMKLHMRGGVSARIVIRVPEKSFFNALNDVKKVGKVVSESVKGEDVTEQYIDLEARLRNLKAEEEWLVSTMEKARNVQELMMIERELWRIRGEIERIEGQLKYLERRVEYSTISVSIVQPPKEPEPKPIELPEFNVMPVLIAALTAIYYIAYGLIFLIIVGTPLAAIGYAGFKLYRKFAPKKK